MRSFIDAKAMAKTLRSTLESRQVNITHAEALEIIAMQFGFANWNGLSAKIQDAAAEADVKFNQTAPIMRIFDEVVDNKIILR